MKIYSWNMLYRNLELDRAFEFVAHTDFDVFCLQEVPPEFLKRLQTLPYHVAFCSEREILLDNSTVHNFIVTLSKYPIEKQGEIQFPDYWKLLPLRTRLFVHLMPTRFFARINERSALYSDIAVGGISIRVFNLHLILAQPTLRLKEFEMAMRERDPSRPTIVCGDFNIIQSPHISVLNWLLGGSLADALLYNRERREINMRFAAHKLVNALAGKITHRFSHSQLDHILLSQNFSIDSAVVIADRRGSDHNPIAVHVSVLG